METKNLADENFRKLAELFPDVVTETKDAEGRVVRAIDKDKLMQAINGFVVDDSQERYQFTWPDKRKAIILANTPINKTLRLQKEKSVGRDGTPGGTDSENIYIEGDNLDALKLLRETYLGKVKMIYIDPPYNTGSDFIYNDTFKENADEYQNRNGENDEEGNQLVQNTESNGRFHTDWLNMIYPRLKLAKDLLSDDGVIFISIDDHEQVNLKKCCDEIFGVENLVAIVPWQSRASVQNDTDFSVNHEYVFVYAKKRRRENRRLKESNYKDWHKRDSFVCRPLPLDSEKFDNPDKDPRGLWKADPFDAPNIRPNLTYAIVNPNTGEELWPPEGRHWRFSKDKFDEAIEDNRVVWTNNGFGRPQLKVFYEEKKDFGSVDNSWFSAQKIGTTTNGTKELMKLFDGKSYFDTPKPTSLMEKLIYLANLPDDSIVLDFFSGSATTAAEVINYNAINTTHYKYVLIQIPDIIEVDKMAYKDGYKTICDIGEERIRRAGKKIKEETHADIDYGFRCFTIDSSNMNDVYYAPNGYSQEGLDLFADNIKSDRAPEDLLVQVMLELGILLSSKVEKLTIVGKQVFSVMDGYLLACFEPQVNEEVITEMAKRKPRYAVLRDDSMASDSVAANFDQIFMTYSPETQRKVL